VEVEYSNIIQELLGKLDPDRPYEQAILATLVQIAKALGQKPVIEVPPSNVEKYLEGIYNYLGFIASQLGAQEGAPAPTPSPAPTPTRMFVTTIPIPADWFKEIDTPGDGVTVSPGNREKILEYDVPNGFAALLFDFGANDVTYTSYSLYTDGKAIIRDADTPLGLYNAPYRFPHPLIFKRKLVAEVFRHADAPAEETYIAKARIILIPEELADVIMNIWGGER